MEQVDQEEHFLRELLKAVENNNLILPAQPEAARRIREAMANPKLSIPIVADAVSKDAAITAKLMRTANSAFARGRVPADSLSAAITRLGMEYTQYLVTSLAMSSLFKAKNTQTNSYLSKAWARSTLIASYSQVLAEHYTEIPKGAALLSGLLHNIGVLPILAFSESHPELFEIEGAIERTLYFIHPRLGSAILKKWNFPENITIVPIEHLQIARKASIPDLADVVFIACLLAESDLERKMAKVWVEAPAFRRLKLDASFLLSDFMNHEQEIKQGLALFEN
jgi:HD-like signal output (HDOD) protein